MSRTRPAAGCTEVLLAVPCALEPGAQVALEDYARTLTGASAAEAVESTAGVVSGVHLCGLSGPVTAAAERDLVDFAREMASAAPGGGLGWS
jgi:hypothetical protein